MKFTVIYEPDARRELRRLSADIGNRVMERLAKLADDVDAHPHEALTGPLRGELQASRGRLPRSLRNRQG